MPRVSFPRTSAGQSAISSSSSSGFSQDSDLSTNSSHTRYTNNTLYSLKKPIVKHYEHYTECKVSDEPLYHEKERDIGPRASAETYASTVVPDEDNSSSNPASLCPLMRRICYHPDAIATTPSEFGDLFPSTRRILIQHDDTTPDGNLNLRLDTELSISKGHKVKLTLFHLRMHNLAERQFSLRRYQRQSGREVCSSKRKYLKPIANAQPSSSSGKKNSLSSALNRINPRAWTSKPATKPLPRTQDEESDDDLGNFAAQAEVAATIPTNTIKIEFSNYAQVEVQQCRKGDNKVYNFEYWGQRYMWRKNLYQDELETVFSFELVSLVQGICVAHITPDRLSQRQSRQELSQGSWVPPCSMRITDKQISSDLGDVIVATGLIVLADDCIRSHWRDAHRP